MQSEYYRCITLQNDKGMDTCFRGNCSMFCILMQLCSAKKMPLNSNLTLPSTVAASCNVLDQHLQDAGAGLQLVLWFWMGFELHFAVLHITPWQTTYHVLMCCTAALAEVSHRI